MEIFKIVIHAAGSLQSYCDPRIFFNQESARQYAKGIVKEGFWDEVEVGSVIIYRERPDNKLGWFVTVGQEAIK